jgi:hypothetical protein
MLSSQSLAITFVSGLKYCFSCSVIWIDSLDNELCSQEGFHYISTPTPHSDFVILELRHDFKYHYWIISSNYSSSSLADLYSLPCSRLLAILFAWHLFTFFIASPHLSMTVLPTNPLPSYKHCYLPQVDVSRNSSTICRDAFRGRSFKAAGDSRSGTKQ